MANAKLIDHNGSPAISIDGKVYPPMMATIRTNQYSDPPLIDEDYFAALGKSGVKLFFLICDTQWLKPGAFSQFTEEAERLLKAVPDAYIFIRIGMHPPVSWCEEHPEELVHYSDGIFKPANLFTESFRDRYPAMYSLCSEKWREDAGKALLETCKKIEELPYGDRIAGCFFAAGGTSEWYYITPTEYTRKTDYLDTGGWEQEADPGLDGVYGDVGPAFHKNFSKFLKDKYKTDENLQKAWKNPNVTLENPTIPDCEGRYYVYGVDYDMTHPEKLWANSEDVPAPGNGTNIGTFLDVDKRLDVYDFYRAWHQGTADSVIYFGNLIKRHYPNMLTGAFYGSAGSCKFHSMGQIGSVCRILESDAIDFLASPGVYENRQLGGFTGQRQNFDSFRLKNKMFVVEEDARTHMENRFYRSSFEVYTEEDSENLLKREFGRNICNDLQAWWFDQLIGGKRYKFPKCYELFAKQEQIARDAYSRDRRKVSQIAFIVDEDSYHLISNESDHQMVELFNNYEIDKIGAPSDRYFKSDFLNEAMPDYKLYVFLNVLCTNEAERQAIHRKLRKNGATALFMYGSGIVDFEKDIRWNIANMEALTGFKLDMIPGVYQGKFKINRESHPIAERLDRGEIYGDFTRKMWANASSFVGRVKTSSAWLYPLLYANDPQAKNLGYFLDSAKPALSVKEMDGYRAIYCGSKYLGCDVIKEIARFAGCHIYSDTDDVLYANANYVTVHAARSGHKTIHLPKSCTVTDAYEATVYGADITELELEMLKGETKMFRLG